MADPKVASTEKPIKKASPANAAYSAATTALREAHKDEFVALLKQAYNEAGLEYKPRLTAAERAAKVESERLAKARAKVEALQAEFGDAVIPSFPTVVDDAGSTDEVASHLTEPTF